MCFGNKPKQSSTSTPASRPHVRPKTKTNQIKCSCGNLMYISDEMCEPCRRIVSIHLALLSDKKSRC